MLLDKTDSYKVSHYLQMPENMEYSHYYIESRSKGEMKVNDTLEDIRGRE